MDHVSNQTKPEEISKHLKNNDRLIDDISVAKPGFINIKFKKLTIYCLFQWTAGLKFWHF